LKTRTELDEMNTVGGYGGGKSDPLLAKYQVELIQTAIRGRNPDPEKPHLADFDLRFAETGQPRQVTCPGGQKVSVQSSGQQKSFVARGVYFLLSSRICYRPGTCRCNSASS
jgi:hypothetical protein